MDLSNLNCPQRVDFNSEEFTGNYSLEDSLNVTLQSNEEGYETSKEHSKLVEPEVTSSCLQSTINPLEMDDTCSETTFGSYESGELEESKENFYVNKPENCVKNPKSQVQKVTIAKPFHFQTDDRIKNKAESNVYKEENFQSKLRQNAVSQAKPHRVTQVQPFHLNEGKKRKHVEEYKSMAQLVADFQKTPDRCHGSSKGFQPQEHWEPPHLTAKTPHLQAVKRRRVVDALSKEEQEEKEVQEMKSHVFHARPLNPKIYSSSKNKSKIGTKASAQATTKKQQFKARPVPTDILNGPTGLGEKKVKPATAPKSPEFKVESRLEKRKLLENKKSGEASTSAQPQQKVKKPGPPPVTVPWTKRCTSVQPFSFDRDDQERFLNKEKKIQEIHESETKVHVFHAQLMPSQSSPPPLPSVPKKPLTVPEPFNFHLEGRNSNHRSFMQSMTEEKEHFKAQPATVLVKKPFVPKPCQRQETEIQEFNLHTGKRAWEKEQQRQLKEAEEQEREQALLLLKAQEEERERLELQKLRSELVHKANPIRQYKPIDIKPSSVPLTQPESPSFEIEKRLQSRH